MVIFEVAGEVYPLGDATATWLAAELVRLDIDRDVAPGNAVAAAILIEHAFTGATQTPIRLTGREAVQVERILDVGLTADDSDGIELRDAIRRAYRIL
jgi:hypothetical protein